MNMNIQNLMKQAQKMQKDMLKTQEELSNSLYTGESTFVSVVLNGNKEMKSIKIKTDEDLSDLDMEMIEDMIVVAFNDAVKKVDVDKEKKMSKYGQGLSGLM